MSTHETQLKLSRIVIPVRDLELMSAFYQDVIGLEPLAENSSGMRCFDNGGVVLCLQVGVTSMRDDNSPGPRLVFFAPDVAQLHEQLIEQGVQLGKMRTFGQIISYDGIDPEGNPFRLSNQA